MSWWEEAVGYEVYIRSFADGNGDGTGDLAGLTERLDHLAWLGVDAVWVTPFYPSPMADFGYDVADYVDIDPLFGDLAGFDRLAARAKELGLRLMVDLVPNHTSHRHQWFVEALAEPGSDQRRYYLFRPPGPGGEPPNNWLSHFGGPAWTLDRGSNEYYCHLFLAEQPDLDWSNEAVRAEFDAILRFWVDRGVDGFRIDVAHALCKDPELRDNAQLRPVPPDATPNEAFSAFEHRYDQGLDTTLDIYRRWRQVTAGADVLLLGEVYVTDPLRAANYLDRGGLHHALFFALNRRPWDPVNFAADVRLAVDASQAGFAWTIASHDESRPVTRFGGGTMGRERCLALWTAFCGLPGMPFLYQGDELGLEDGYVAPEHVQDPLGKAAYEEGRDPCRTPMPWEPGGEMGFTTASEAWLVSPTRPDSDTVAVQRDDPSSTLHRFRELLATRRTTAGQRAGPTVWLQAPPGTLCFMRGSVIHLSNLTDEEVAVDLPPGRWSTLYGTDQPDADQFSAELVLPPRTGRVMSGGL